MAIREITPFNYGGGEITSALARSISDTGSAIFGAIKERREDQELKKAKIAEIQSNVDPVTEMIEWNKERYSEYFNAFNTEVEKIVTDKGKNLSYEDIIKVNSLANKTKSHFNQLKEAEGTVLKNIDAYNRDKGKYDQDVFNSAIEEYKKTGKLSDEQGNPLKFLEEAAIDVDQYVVNATIRKTPFSKVTDETDTKKVETAIYATDEERQGRFTNDFMTSLGLRKGTVKKFSSLTTEEQERYNKLAEEVSKGGYSTGDKTTDAALLWGIDNVAKKIQPNTTNVDNNYKTPKETKTNEKAKQWSKQSTPEGDIVVLNTKNTVPVNIGGGKLIYVKPLSVKNGVLNYSYQAKTGEPPMTGEVDYKVVEQHLNTLLGDEFKKDIYKDRFDVKYVDKKQTPGSIGLTRVLTTPGSKPLDKFFQEKNE